MSTKTRVRHPQSHAGNGEMKQGPTEKPILGVPKLSEEKRARLIQVRAYELWERGGKPDGNAASERFWCEAEKDILASHG